jgi:hypothetical protein
MVAPRGFTLAFPSSAEVQGFGWDDLSVSITVNGAPAGTAAVQVEVLTRRSLPDQGSDETKVLGENLLMEALT